MYNLYNLINKISGNMPDEVIVTNEIAYLYLNREERESESWFVFKSLNDLGQNT